MFKKILNPRLLRSALFALCVGSGSAQAAPAIRIVSTVPSAGMVTVTLNADAAATGHLTLLQGSGASCGSAAQIAVGQDSTNAPAYRQGALALAAGANASYTVRNLAQSTSYTLCATNGAGIDTATFSTAPMATYSVADWEAVGGAGISAGSAHSQSLSFAPDGTPYVAYSDGGNNNKTTVKSYNGAGWVNVGDAGFSAGWAEHQSLSFAPDGTPYVAYTDNNKSNKATVMRFVSGSWQVVGGVGFSAGAAQFSSLAFAPDGTPHVAYRDGGYGAKTTVMRYNGTAWVEVGSAGGLSVGLASYQSLSFAPDGTPYVAYMDNSKSYKTTVMRFVSGSWALVGSPGFSAGEAGYQSLSFAPDGTPYVAYRDVGNGGKATVMRFVGGSWETVGSPGFSAGEAYYQSLSFAPDGTPYVAYQDYGNSQKTTVMSYNGTDWVEVGSPGGLSAGEANDQSLAFAPDGTPYVAYRDEGSGGKTTVMRLAPVVPSAPTAVTAVAGNGQATVSFTAPAVAGSSVITGYTVTSNPDNITGSCTASPCTVTGLTIGQAYTFTVTANNGAGSSAASDASSTVTPIASTLGIVRTGPAAGMVTVTLNTNITATGYLTLLPGSSATCGTAANVQAGKASGGTVNAYRYGSLALAANTDASYTVRNLAHSTDYTLCATDSAGSAVVSANFSTPAMTTYTNPSWQAVGGAGVSAGMAHHQSLSFAPDGTPHVAYRDDDKGGYTTVIRYNGTAWVDVGSAGFSAKGAFSQSLSFAPDGTPYVAYLDVSNGYGTTVMRYNGTAWVDVTGFPPLQADFQSLTFAPDGTPYVAFQAKGTGGHTTVRRYNGTDWVDVGIPEFSAGLAAYQSLSFAPDGTPYVAYRDDSKSYKTTVMGFVSGSWQVVGIPGFSAGAASSQSLTFAPDGTPYVAYRDDGTSNRTTVMRFVSGSWQNVGSAGFSAGGAAYQSLSFAPDGTPYVAYRDDGNGGKTTVMRLVTVPSAPIPVTAVAGNGTVALSWTAPSSDGGSAITGYSVTGSPGGTCTPSPVTATTCTATGLTNGTAYTFSVVASNTVGNSAPATSTAVTPVAPAPPAPPPPPPPPPPPALIQLQVSTHGTGAGTVQRSVAGRVMSTVGNTTTVEYVEGQSVTLTAQPQAGARFSGWMGACSGLLPCHLTLRSNQAAQATFTDTSTPSPVASCRSHVFSANEERVQDAYLAYYGRPADVAGLSYWVAYLASERGQIAAIIDAFGQSAEFQQRFGQLSNKQLIANLYQQMYAREPDAAGAAFFESQLAAGRSSLASIAIHILDGRQGSDSAVVDNRKKVVRHFVTRFEELGSAAPTVDDGDALARFLSAVNGDEASALAGCARVDAFFDKAAP